MTDNNFYGDSLIDLLEARAKQRSTDILYRFLGDNGGEASILRYAELATQAKVIAVELTKYASIGDRVLLVYPPGLELISAYFGCLYAGLVAVPVYPPLNIKLVEKLQRIMVDATPTLIISTTEIERKIKHLKLFKQLNKIPGMQYLAKQYWSSVDNLLGWDFETLRWICTSRLSIKQAENWHKPPVAGEQLAFLQYTSGSTGWPKGVMLSHENLLHNLQLISAGFSLQATDSIVGWLPPYHDMGLIGNILTALYQGIECTLMSPLTFLQNPLRWLQAIDNYQATISGGPNFAYDYCTRKITEEQAGNLNLENWQLAFNGAEPIHPQVLERFAARFKSCGFNRKAFFPCYGLAEATLFVAGARRGEGYHTATYTDKKTLIECGRCAQNVCIVNLETQTLCNDGEVGEIWVQGESVAKGYWENVQVTQEVFAAQLPGATSKHYLRTGDLGFIKDEGLYVTGRLKDLIIIHGVNHYPQDIEYTLSHCHEQIRPGCCAAFSITAEAKEQLAVVCEVGRAKDPNCYEIICQNIGKAVAEAHELAVHTIVLIQSKSLPKTTSGKIRRRYTKELLQAHKLRTLYEWTLHKNSTGVIVDEKPHEKTPTEITLLEIYSVVFEQATAICLADNFFSLGGDSLSAMQLVSRIRATWHIELDPHLFFKDPSVAEVAKIIESSAKISIGKSEPLNTIPVCSRMKKIPLSFSQQRLWFLHQLHPEQAIYNLPTIIHIEGALDETALEKAMQTIIARHEILRTAFPQENGQPYQRILPTVDFQLIKLHFADSSFETATQQMQTFIKKTITTPFDLSQGNLFRAYSLSATQQQVFTLLLVVHHIVIDGWSLGIFVDELGQLYNTYCSGHFNSPLKPLPIQFADYSQWQQMTQSKLIATQLAFWQQQLQDAPTQLMLPTDKPRPKVASYQGESLYVKINSQTVQILKALAKQQECSLHMVLLTLFEVLLYRYTQQTDLVVASVVANRHHAQVKNLIGFFVNTLALRSKIANTPTAFLTQLAQTRHTVLDALANQDAPFDQVVQTLNIKRDLSVNPLTQVMFILQNSLRPRLDLKNLNITFNTDSHSAKFDLTLECIEENEDITCRFEYATDLFHRATIQCMAQHFVILASRIALQPDADIHTICFLDQEEKNQLVNWNATRCDYPQQKTIHQLFEEQAKQTPYDIAVVFKETQLTYSVLNARANRLARYLRDTYQIQGDDLIALYLDRSEQMLIAILAVLKAGAAYVPVDISYPEERISYILTDTRAKVVLTNAMHQIKLTQVIDYKKLGTQVQAIDNRTMRKMLTTYDIRNLKEDINSTHLAYVIYTSGTTGQPKGVMIEHKSVVNLISMQAKTFELSRESKGNQTPLNCLWYANYVFDAHVWELFAVITTGHTVHIVPDTLRQDLPLLARYLQVHKIAMATLPPAILTSDWLPALQTLIVAGESTEPSLLAYYKSQHINIINAYGPTEATVCATFNSYQDGELNTQIGKPVANVTTYILDQYLNQLPVGVIGELYIGGAGLARGYLNLPVLTAERFIANPFQTAAEKQAGENARLYRSGDLARYLPDGNIEFMGRNDSQVKIRGFRVELNEIGIKLASFPGVKQAVVLVKESGDASGYNKYLVGYYVANKPLEENVMLNYLHGQLPGYMVPGSLVWLAQLPLTINGKLDHKALPAPGYHPQAIYMPASNAVEKQLINIWCEILKIERIGINDNFFELGGHSLLGVRLVQKIAQVFNRKLPVSVLFTHPTIKAMGQLCRGDGAVMPADPLVPLKPTGERAPLFIVHPVGGHLLSYQTLSQYWQVARPLYGLQQVLPASSITAMAEMYIDAMRKIQATGPYCLAGWSMGGIIAHEMAYQLEQAGKAVHFVGLIDSFYGGGPIVMADLQESQPLPIELLRVYCEDFWKSRNKLCAIRKQDLIKNSLTAQLEVVLMAAKDDQLLSMQTNVEDLFYIVQQSYQNSQLVYRHRPKLIKSNLVLFRASSRNNWPEHMGQYSLDWQKYTAGKIFIHELTGDHYSILQMPCVLNLIHFLEDYLKPSQLQFSS